METKVKISEVTEELINLFDRINIQMPSNFNKIRDFIYNKIPNVWNEDDIAFGFKLWVESKV